MSSQIVERELTGFIAELQRQGRHADAALLDWDLFMSRGYLPGLVALRDRWAAELECHHD